MEYHLSGISRVSEIAEFAERIGAMPMSVATAQGRMGRIALLPAEN
jgi:hypothetical protein